MKEAKTTTHPQPPSGGVVKSPDDFSDGVLFVSLELAGVTELAFSSFIVLLGSIAKKKITSAETVLQNEEFCIA